MLLPPSDRTRRHTPKVREVSAEAVGNPSVSMSAEGRPLMMTTEGVGT
jgi:hypothetical protein